jgi:ABC-type branched-subunit amino acid transport system ATPase component
VISAQAITRRFGERVAVEDVTFEVRGGEQFAVCGSQFAVRSLRFAGRSSRVHGSRFAVPD